ncbi:MAG: DUF4132 domain-containing protein [Planctomycetaceae bacterium]
MKHNFSKWFNELSPSFRDCYKFELSQLDRVLSAAAEPLPRAMRETELRYLAYPDAKYKIAIAALQCASVSRNSYPEDCKALCVVLKVVLKGSIPIQAVELERLLELLLTWPVIDPQLFPVDEVIGQIERSVAGQPAPAQWQPLLEKVRQAVDAFAEKKTKSIDTLLTRIANLCNSTVIVRLKPDQGWADLMRQDVAGLSNLDSKLWERLLSHASSVRPEPPAKDWDITQDASPLNFADIEAYWHEYDRLFFARCPATEWKETIKEHITAVGAGSFQSHRLKWLQAVSDSKPGTLSQFSVNREILRGLLWTCEHSDDAELTRAIRIAAEYLYRKNSPLGATSVQILAHLRSSNSQEELTHLLNQVKSQSHVRLVESARTLVAERTGVPVAHLDDLLLPDSGFSEIGRRVETFSGFQAELTVGRSGSVELRWFKPNGEPQKSIPARVKREHAGEIRSLKAVIKDVKSTLAKARDRLEFAPLEQRSWTINDWRKQYFEHPVAGTIGCRILWKIEQNDDTTIAAFDGESLVDVQGRTLEVSPTARVSVWHPIGSPADVVLSWREWLLAHEVRQPFKQAHREIYIVTDAERETELYSNRFAAHILKQSQFRALAKTRGWETHYLGPWGSGDRGIATRKLPAWNLRAELWTNAAGDEAADAGGFFYIATDQVRFYRMDSSDPLPLIDVPQIPFSEIMRDVDLFVGVASVGNDPTWQDGGPQGRYRDYWHTYSFGELSGSATTRKQVLERLVPRLKIADRCSLSDRFLVVRGNKRTYKIHLGSGNILMEPNDQYLCIVPDSRARAKEDDLYLPFEGDGVLSIIISKALLLAADDKIKDPTITRQIG